MRVILTTSVSGTRNGEDWPARGSEVDLPDDEAADMIAAGLAKPVEAAEAPAVETATVDHEDAETATAPRKRGARKV